MQPENAIAIPAKKPQPYNRDNRSETRNAALEKGRMQAKKRKLDAQEKFVELLSQGLTTTQALERVGHTESWYVRGKRDDEWFRTACNTIIDRRFFPDENAGVVPDFPEFCRKYLHQPLNWHQLQWYDLLEGREPRELHPAQTYEPGDGTGQFILVNTPPNHAKSTTISMNYVTWRIVKDPNVRIILVSQSLDMARKFVYGVQTRLRGGPYRDLMIDFAPPEGWEKHAQQWTQDRIVLGGKDDGEKDPTLQALGMGGQIYGARADLIVLDDVVLMKNAHDYEDQAHWLGQEVITRLDPDIGRLLVIGTRVAPRDLYKHLREAYPGEYTYLAQPAVLEERGGRGDPSEWLVLWPERWPGEKLERFIRRKLNPSHWSRAYQQADVAEDQIFPEEAVRGCLNKQRMAGILKAGAPGHRELGMTGLYVICSMDPALSGACASIVMAVDVKTGKRWILDLHNQFGMTPTAIHELIRKWTEKYNPREWRIEKNAMQGMLTQDEALRDFLNSRGCRLIEHFTGVHKWDDDYGVAGMAPLFLPVLEGREPLIDIPYNRTPGGHAAIAADSLISQLVSWTPRDTTTSTRRAQPGTTDLVMALWFANIRANELVMGRTRAASFRPNPYASRARLKQRYVVNIEDALMAQSEPASLMNA